MAILEIVKYPAPILKKTASPVDKITKDIKRLVNDMFDTMYASEGVGLAAPQVGMGLRIIVVDVSTKCADEESKQSHKYVMINPVITNREGEIEWEEGCLSIPEFRLKVKRAMKITVNFLDKDGCEKVFEAEGLPAVAIQHEIDHLDGILLIDNASRLKRDIYLRKIKKGDPSLPPASPNAKR